MPRKIAFRVESQRRLGLRGFQLLLHFVMFLRIFVEFSFH